MALSYLYCSVSYDTEADAQAAVVLKKNELDTSPTHWVSVKTIEGSEDSGWLINAGALSDAEIGSLDTSKTYCVCSFTNGENFMPMTASEVTSKISELRTIYASANAVDKMYSFEFNSRDVPILEIDLDTNMSEYT